MRQRPRQIRFRHCTATECHATASNRWDPAGSVAAADTSDADCFLQELNDRSIVGEENRSYTSEITCDSSAKSLFNLIKDFCSNPLISPCSETRKALTRPIVQISGKKWVKVGYGRGTQNEACPINPTRSRAVAGEAGDSAALPDDGGLAVAKITPRFAAPRARAGCQRAAREIRRSIAMRSPPRKRAPRADSEILRAASIHYPRGRPICGSPEMALSSRRQHPRAAAPARRPCRRRRGRRRRPHPRASCVAPLREPQQAVVLVGQGKRLELWDAEQWQVETAQAIASRTVSTPELSGFSL